MNYCFSIQHPSLLEPLLALSQPEILWGVKGLSRRGQFEVDETPLVLEKILAAGGSPILLWDLPLTDQALARGLTILEPWVSKLRGVKVADLGAARALKRHWPELPLHLSLELSSPNAATIHGWAAELNPARICLSNQLPIKAVAGLDKTGLPPLEVQALGPLEVFFSSRPLLDADQAYRALEAVSLERPRQVNRLWQSPQGTCMLHSRDLFLLDRLASIEAAGVGGVRLEFAELKEWQAFEAAQGDFLALKAAWPRKITAGFFCANRTDRPVKRLTNARLAQVEGQQVGEVLEASKGAYCLIQLEISLNLPVQLGLVNPEGKEFTLLIERLEKLSGEQVSGISEPGAYLIPFVKGALARSLLLLP
ncbi:MAG: U32 family peptidase [bacterium]|nr:U32 family peptidase [bacterium]